MLFASGALVLVELSLLVFCTLSVITSPPEQCRNLPKMVWLVLVIALPLVGGIAWLVAGRPQRPARAQPGRGGSRIPAEYDRPGRAVAANPDDDAAFLEQLRKRAEEQRRRAAEQHRDDGEGTSP